MRDDRTPSQVFSHANFMAPIKIRVGRFKGGFYELATNTRVRQSDGTYRSMVGPPPSYFGMPDLFGVSVVLHGKYSVDSSMSKVFNTQREAEDYIKTL
jgi:hypothetical protein